jgi:predicted metal-binding membrane protein
MQPNPESQVLADRIRSMLGVHWLLLFAAILMSWGLLYAMAIPAELRDASRIFGSEFWVALCTITPDAAGFAKVALMWLLMSTAMMLPTALPAFAAYEDLSHSGAEVSLGPLAGGFLAVWGGFAILAAGLQIALFHYDLVSSFGDSRSTWLSATLLLIAGGYQFTPLKEACLSKCRAPMMFFMQHWGESPARLGFRLGATCLGCCWALMLLAFVGGVMSLAFMGLATLIMTLEKLPDIGRWLSQPLGFVLIGSAGWIVATGL